MANELQTQLPTDTWISASWEDYLQIVESDPSAKAKGYYYKGYMRVEMLPVGHDHAADEGAIALAINLFCMIKGIPSKILPNCSYRKAGIRECQPDISVYFRQKVNSVPFGTAIIDLNRFPAPDLVVEISATTLLDDLGTKRSLYEELGVAEYWVIDVQNREILAYTMANQGSQRIQDSQILPGLAIAILESALRRSRETDQSQVGNWLFGQFQGG